MSNPIAQITTLARAASGTGRIGFRNRLVVLVAGISGASARDLASMTLKEAQARCRAAGLPKAAEAVDRFLEAHGGNSDDLLIRSRKGRGERPVSRVTVWRIIHSACQAGLRHLQRLSRAIAAFLADSLPQPKMTPEPVPAGSGRYRPLTLSDYQKSRGSG